MLFPRQADWLDTYLHELLGFPNSKHDDQVDSTALALAWITANPEPGIIGYYRMLAEEAANADADKKKLTRVWVPGDSSHYYLITGRAVCIPHDRIIEVTGEELESLLRNGAKRVN